MNLSILKTAIFTAVLALGGGATNWALQNDTVSAAVPAFTVSQTADEEPATPAPLGLTAEARAYLVAEMETAFSAAVTEAQESGLITAEQATQLQARGFQFQRGGGGRPHGGPGGQLDHILPEGTMLQITADALGISVEELQAAHEGGQRLPELVEELGLDMDTVQANIQTGLQAAIAQAVTDGTLTQEEADAILANMALREIGRDLHHEALATALGLTAEELQTYHDAGLRLPEIVAELGLDMDTVREAITTAWDEAVAQAVADGRITAEQAEQLRQPHGGQGQPGRPGGHGGHGNGNGGRGMGNGTGTNAPGFTPATTTNG